MRPIVVKNAQRRLRINTSAVTQLVSFVLDAESVPTARGLNLVFTNDATIRRYNRQFLNHDYPTDVISFPDSSDSSAGDIIISAQRAFAYTAQHNIPLPSELARYVIHGVLHCLGYSDTSPAARRRMFARQEALLRQWLRRDLPLCSPAPNRSYSSHSSISSSSSHHR